MAPVRRSDHRHATALPRVLHDTPRPARVRFDFMNRQNTIIWTDPAHAATLIDAVQRAGLTLVAIGGADTRGFDRSLLGDDVRVFNDPRATLMSEKPGVFLSTAIPDGPDPLLDGRTINELRAAGTSILTTVPPVGGILEASEAGMFKESGGSTPAASVRLTPRVRRHPSYTAATDLLEDFGRASMMIVEAFVPKNLGGLPAAMLTAIDAIITVIGVPELVDAAAPRPTKKLGDLDGYSAALLRFPDGRCGQLLVSDRAPWGWRITLNGERGRLTMRTGGFDWISPEGDTVDSTRVDASIAGYAGAIASSLRAASGGAMVDEPSADWVGLLSTAEAILLSTRTGQPESPTTIARASVVSSL